MAPAPTATPAPAATPPAPAHTAAAPATAPSTPAPARGSAAYVEPSEAEQQAHRAAVLDALHGNPRIAAASWSTRSTLGVAMRAGSEAAMDELKDVVCKSVVAYEELRFTRLEMRDVAARTESEGRVRWAQCK